MIDNKESQVIVVHCKGCGNEFSVRREEYEKGVYFLSCGKCNGTELIPTIERRIITK